MKKIRLPKQNLLSNTELFSVRGGAAVADCEKYKVKCTGDAKLEIKSESLSAS